MYYKSTWKEMKMVIKGLCPILGSTVNTEPVLLGAQPVRQEFTQHSNKRA